MKLNCWSKPQKWLNETGFDLDASGILEAQRFIYLFFDENAIKNHQINDIKKGELIYGKAIQINLSITQGGKNNIELPPWIRGSDNSTYMTCAMYVFDTIFETDITNIYDARFILNESLISSTTNDYDIHKAQTNGCNLYSKEIRDKPDKKKALLENVFQCAPNIPDPMYYTVRHQEEVEGDMYDINGITSVIEHLGKDLYDNNTRISVMNSTMIQTLEPLMKKKLYDIRNQIRNSDFRIKMYDSTELSDSLLYQDFESMQHGYTYIYDTNLGFNILNPKINKNGILTSQAYVPFTKYQFKDKLQYDLERTLDMIKHHARNIEQEFGPVRIHFTPMYFGDKTDTYFKDWNSDHQPIINNKVDIDNGFKVTNEINARLTDTSSINPDEEQEDDYDW